MTTPTPAEIEARAKALQQARESARREREAHAGIEREFADWEERIARLGAPGADAREALVREGGDG